MLKYKKNVASILFQWESLKCTSYQNYNFQTSKQDFFFLAGLEGSYYEWLLMLNALNQSCLNEELLTSPALYFNNRNIMVKSLI